MASVIVFGPTGNVGSHVATTAASHGAKVALAMRDTSKTIPGLTAEKEKAGGYQRVTADLSKPDTLSSAVKTSGAKRAFIYLAHGSSDHMKSALQALKSAGIEFVVFLSSFTIYKDPKEITPVDLISFIHAQVELSLDEVFGPENFVAVRPGAFATNLLREKQYIQAGGKVPMYGSQWEMDGITNNDMGEVAGTILATGPRNGQHIVFLYGPQLMGTGEYIKSLGKVLGKDLEVEPISAEAALDKYLGLGVPKPLAEYLIKTSGQPKEETRAKRTNYEQGVKNVEVYTGHPATKFEDWAAKNMKMFTE